MMNSFDREDQKFFPIMFDVISFWYDVCSTSTRHFSSTCHCASNHHGALNRHCALTHHRDSSSPYTNYDELF